MPEATKEDNFLASILAKSTVILPCAPILMEEFFLVRGER